VSKEKGCPTSKSTCPLLNFPTLILVHEAASRLSKDVGVLVDLQGPKIRVGKFKSGQVDLEVGQPFSFDTECEFGDESRVGLDYKELVKDVDKVYILLLNDGKSLKKYCLMFIHYSYVKVLKKT
jgi:hypothetical protein